MKLYPSLILESHGSRKKNRASPENQPSYDPRYLLGNLTRLEHFPVSLTHIPHLSVPRRLPLRMPTWVGGWRVQGSALLGQRAKRVFNKNAQSPSDLGFAFKGLPPLKNPRARRCLATDSIVKGNALGASWLTKLNQARHESQGSQGSQSRDSSESNPSRFCGWRVNSRHYWGMPPDWLRLVRFAIELPWRHWRLQLVMVLLFSLLPHTVAAATGDNLFDRGINRPPESNQLNPESQNSLPFLIVADEIKLVNNGNIMIARGRVEIAQGKRILRADEVSYNKTTDSLTTSAISPRQVSLTLETGDVIYGKEILSSGDLKNAIIDSFRMLMVDNTRLAAAAAIHVVDQNGERNELQRAVISPCALCPKDPSRAPLWQLVAAHAYQDSQSHDITYYSVRMEIYGLPIFWLPYLSHPDWTVKRRSGFLSPSLIKSSKYGSSFRIPYYQVINDQSDLTIEPIWYSNKQAGVGLQLRHRFSFGIVELSGSGIYNYSNKKLGSQDPNTFGSNIFSRGEFSLSDHWRTQFQIDRVNNAAYLNNHDIDGFFRNPSYNSAATHITTSLSVEGFYDRNYSNFSGYSFQGITNKIDKTTLPLILPFAYNSTYLPLPREFGSLKINSSLLSLNRVNNEQTSRFTSELQYNIQAISPFGLVTRLSTILQGDYYFQKAIPITNIDNQTTKFSGEISRIFQIIGLRFDYPFTSNSLGVLWYMQPSIQLVGSPRGMNPLKISNNDSQSLNLDEPNLFRLQRFSGYDRVSSGSRIDYGYLFSGQLEQGFNISSFVGQSYRFDRDRLYPIGSGFEKQLSDLLSKTTISPFSWFSISYKVRVNSTDFKPTNQEIDTNLKFSSFNIALNYVENKPQRISTDDQQASNSNRFIAPISKALNLSASFLPADEWKISGNLQRDLVIDKTTGAQVKVRYLDECFAYELSFQQSYYTNGDVRPDTSITLRVGFRFLGDWSYSQSGL